MYYVYLIKSDKDKELYTGSTNNLRRRLWEHNHGKNLSTKYRAPFSLVYYEAYLDESDARHRESSLKLRGNALSQLKRRIAQSLLRKIGVRVK
ncbi:MAG: hypothetical protein A3I08_03340 [Candidatus Andersenbacteria bacterium RIFCSPLOWO2_02_FULL_46_11]|nr:MAG: GIY-YIG nuclease superfamily protein [Parcubacteria group bacterium GW2011_GWA2_45_14]OGY35938.1 MAG: hypothetical protein A3B76_04150 [Candidatus Andersenbacteria bacterium RIFCSPHIGHO2_02_FULL_46_16]OGY38280.1 MAG: hypothetical protein A3I08_03340 [Candidatus Andersenbacteria bacterium RIFCSPLOWO2_02_FULL_46_11]